MKAFSSSSWPSFFTTLKIIPFLNIYTTISILPSPQATKKVAQKSSGAAAFLINLKGHCSMKHHTSKVIFLNMFRNQVLNARERKKSNLH